MTSNNGGSGGNNFGQIVHTAGRPGNQPVVFNSAYRGSVSLVGTDDPGNAVYSFGQRTLVNDVLALIFKDAYDYSIILPQTFGTTYASLNEATGQLLIQGGSGTSDDVIQVTRDGNDIVVSVDIGSDVGGTGPRGDSANQAAFVSRFAASAVSSIQINAGAGNDSITVAPQLNEPITIDGGTHTTADTLSFLMTGVTGYNFTNNGNGTGSLTSASHQTVSWSNIETANAPPPENLAPIIDDQSLPNIAENSPNGTVVGTVSASDPNSGQSLTFSITGGNTGGAFAINSLTGQITVANTAALDFETTPVFNLTVEVIDNGGPPLLDSATVTINLIDVAEGGSDSDDQISEAIVVSTESTTINSISNGNDVDMYGFTVVAGQTVFFDIDARGGAPISDSVIRLFNASGVMLASNDNAAGLGPEANNLESFLRYTFTTAGAYYLGVSGYNNSTYDPVTGTGDAGTITGDYALNIGTTRVLDDGEAGYTFVGSWAAGSGGFTGNAGGTTSDTRYVQGDATADRFARASFSGLTAGQYRVLATYRVGTTNSTAATYTMLSGIGGTVYGSGILNQRNTPNDYSYTNSFNTKGFEQIATIDITGATLMVQLSDQGTDRIWADGIMIERIGEVTPGPKAEVFDGAIAINDGTGVANFGAVAPGTIVDKTFTVRNTGDVTLIVHSATVSGSGYTLLSNLGNNTVIAPGNSVTFTVRFSRPASGIYGGTVSFNTNDVRPTHQTYNFNLTGQVTETQYIDDGDPGFSTVGLWANSSGGRLTDIKYVAGAATATKFARWTFNIANPGSYRVSASYRIGSTNASNANYRILTGVGGTQLGQRFIDQRTTANDLIDATDSLAPNSKWEDIATVIVSGSQLVVELSDQADGRVYADSIRIERVGDLPSAQLFTTPAVFDDELLNSLLS